MLAGCLTSSMTVRGLDAFSSKYAGPRLSLCQFLVCPLRERSCLCRAPPPRPPGRVWTALGGYLWFCWGSVGSAAPAGRNHTIHRWLLCCGAMHRSVVFGAACWLQHQMIQWGVVPCPHGPDRRPAVGLCATLCLFCFFWTVREVQVQQPG